MKRRFNIKEGVIVLVAFIVCATALHAQTLHDYEQLAVENNPGLIAKRGDYEAVLRASVGAGTLPDPTLSGAYGIPFARMDMPLNRWNISIMQMFPWFGSLTASEQKAMLAAQAQYQSYLDARNALLHSTRESYFKLIEVSEQLDAERKTAEILETYKTLATAAFRNAKGSMADVLRVELELDEVRTQITIFESKRRAENIHFNQLLNRDESVEVDLPEPATFTLPVELITTDSIAQVPTMRARQMEIASAQAGERVALKSTYPQLTAGIGYQQMVNLEREANMGMVMPVLGFSLPIYGKKNKAAVESSRLMTSSLQSGIVETENRLRAEIGATAEEMSQAHNNIELYEREIDRSGRVIDLLLAAYRNAGESLDEVLEMQKKQLEYLKLSAAAKRSYRTAYSYLLYLTGKDYE